MEGQPPIKKIKRKTNKSNGKGASEDALLSTFVKWLKEEGVSISQKIKICKRDSCARYGIIAVENIEIGEVLFTIPRRSILSDKTCSIALSLSKGKFHDSSGWVKLILCLMFEYTNKTSKWKPYMKFLPPVESMDQPMFWSHSEQTDLLKGTGLCYSVLDDNRKISNEYQEEALPFIQKHGNLGFDAKVHTLELYRHMVAIIMAYSFTEPSENASDTPMMVPLADVLNHVSRNNARLEYGKTNLVMKSTEFIPAGHEVYNTYGQLSNCQLLQMYGFVEEYPNNIYDTVDIELGLLYTTAEKVMPSIEEKRKWMTAEACIDGRFPITIGREGILCAREFGFVMKVFPMSREEFIQYKKNNEWDSDSEENYVEDELEVIPYQKLIHHPIAPCLISAAKICRRRLCNATANMGAADEDKVGSENDEALRRWRASRSRSLVEGQLRLLVLLIDQVKE